MQGPYEVYTQAYLWYCSLRLAPHPLLEFDNVWEAFETSPVLVYGEVPADPKPAVLRGYSPITMGSQPSVIMVSQPTLSRDLGPRQSLTFEESVYNMARYCKDEPLIWIATASVHVLTKLRKQIRGIVFSQSQMVRLPCNAGNE